MSGKAKSAGMHLIEQGTLVEFEVLETEVQPGPDQAEFGVRVKVRLGIEEEDNDIEWGGLGFMFVLAVLSFSDARARGMSEVEFEDEDELTVADFLSGITYLNGRVRYYGDYVRGRRMKTVIVMNPDGTVVLDTVGRGKAAVHWFDRLKGKKGLQVVDRQR